MKSILPSALTYDSQRRSLELVYIACASIGILTALLAVCMFA